MILNFCESKNCMVNENHCVDCNHGECHHAGEPTTRQRNIDRFDWLRHTIHDIEASPRKATKETIALLRSYRIELDRLKTVIHPEQKRGGDDTMNTCTCPACMGYAQEPETEATYYYCPVCCSELTDDDTVYHDGDCVVGCEHCIRTMSAEVAFDAKGVAT